MAVAWKLFHQIPATGTCFWCPIVYYLADTLLDIQSFKSKYCQSAST
ncbi:hypothetical protein [Nostoc sp.]